MKNSSRNFAHSRGNSAGALAVSPTAAQKRKADARSCGHRRTRRLLLPILSLLSLLPLLSGCADKATYIRGDKGSSGQISVNPMTGTFSVIITGPYEYCSLPEKYKGNAQDVCLPHHQEDTP